MPKFLEVKYVDAQLMTRGDFYPLRREAPGQEEQLNIPGYAITTPDGLPCWIPATEYEKQHFAITAPNNTISQKDVDAMIRQVHVDELEPNDSGTKITVVTATLANEFTITESSTCVDPKNYDREIGRAVCMEKIENKVWLLLGFLLSCGVNGFQKAGV